MPAESPAFIHYEMPLALPGLLQNLVGRLFAGRAVEPSASASTPGLAADKYHQ